MAVIDKKSIQNLNEKESKEKIKDLKLEILKIRSKKGQSASGTKKIKEIKKTIARIHTNLNQNK